MNASDETLHEAVRIYAVLQGRAYWYDPTRIEHQAEVWRLAITSIDPGDGMLTIADFTDAEMYLLRPRRQQGYDDMPQVAVRDVGPTHIIEDACRRAVARRDRAERAVQFPDSLLYAERLTWGQAKASEFDPEFPDRHEHADRTFVKQIEALIYDLSHADLPDTATAPLILNLRERMVKAGLVPTPDLPSLEA